MEISRALLEHYLRATGWTCRPRAERPLDPEWVRGEGERMLGISAGLPQLDAIAAHHGITYATLAFRLGLCAAAEEAIATGHRWLCERHLRAAGIDHAAWEKARRA